MSDQVETPEVRFSRVAALIIREAAAVNQMAALIISRETSTENIDDNSFSELLGNGRDRFRFGESS